MLTKGDCMNRDNLISQVKDEYARLTDMSTKENFTDVTDTDSNSYVYYEDLLQKVINGIQDGKFDDFSSGKEIVETVANNKTYYNL